MKTLDQVEARTTITNLPVYILNPGSYYLTGEHTGTATNNGITIQAMLPSSQRVHAPRCCDILTPNPPGVVQTPMLLQPERKPSGWEMLRSQFDAYAI